MSNDELATHLNSLRREECYRVEAVLKETNYEVTQKVYFVGANGSEQGPFIRKYIEDGMGLGCVYQEIFAAQRSGMRFRHLPLIYDCYYLDTKLTIIMEFVFGETLQDLVYRCNPSFDLACSIFPQLCNALIELHEGFHTPIIHRDLKPSNIMLMKDNLTIIDFGIARLFKDDSSEDTRHFGTKTYAPPEQFGYGQTDERSDVYALGVILHFCLTEKDLGYKTLKNGFVELGLPDWLRQILVKTTEFDPDKRFQSVQSLKNAFLLALERDRMDVVAKENTAGTTEEPRNKEILGNGVIDDEGSSTHNPWPDIENQQTLLPKQPQKPKKLAGWFSKIPPVFGIVWDLILLLIFLAFFLMSLVATFSPTAGSTGANMPVGLRAVQNLSISLFILGAPLFFISDRRPTRRLIPPFSKVPLKTDMLACLAAFLLGVVLIAIIVITVHPS